MAEVYDQLMSDAPYNEWVKFTHFMTNNYLIDRILEVGCGTGELAIRLAKEGYDLTAFDLSEEMVKIARQKSKDNHVKGHFFEHDVIQFELKQTFDLIISYCDVMNYLIKEEDLKKAFHNIYRHLSDGGLFIFDVHSLAYVEWLITREIFTEIREDISYVWLCEQGNHPGEIHHNLTFFIQKEGQMYERYDEDHIQRTYSVYEYKRLLRDVGFNTIQVYYDFSPNVENKDEEEADRVFFVCKKI